MPETVVLLHGLARTARSMLPMKRALESAGYEVINIGYPSTRHPIEELSRRAITALVRSLEGRKPSRLHFVTHSMGGILLRQHLHRHPLPNLGRVVMLAPPNQGSEVVDRLGGLRLFHWINGPAGQQLGTDETSLPRRLGPVNFELGVIIGNRSFNPLLSRLIPGANDGKVSLDSARVEGMRDYLVLPATHTFIMRNPRAIHETIQFLRHGRFSGSEAVASA